MGVDQAPSAIALQRELIDLKEKHQVLEDLVVELHLTTHVALATRLHRSRFAKIMAAHPCAWEASLTEAVNFIVAYVPAEAENLARTSKNISFAAAAAFDRLRRERRVRLFVCGGHGEPSPLSSVDCFDPEAGTWQPGEPMLEARSGAGAVAANGCLYVCGGSSGQSTLNSAEQFNLETGTWSALPKMARARKSTSAAVAGGQLYVCGGHGGHPGMVLSSVERLDLGVATAWEEAPALLRGRWAASCAVMSDRLYVCGGYSRPKALTSVEHFSFGSAWEAAPPMKHGRAGTSAAVVSGALHVCGGTDGHRGLQSVEQLKPGASAWVFVAAMAVPRSYAAAATVAGRLYVCGGNDGQEVFSSMECLDPFAEDRRNAESSERTWKPMPPMMWGRRGAVAAAVVWQRAV